MQVHSTYQFFFHPLSESHSMPTKVLSVITVIALSILTAGLFLAVFTLVNLKDNWKVTKQDAKDKFSIPNGSPDDGSGFVGVQALKRKQAGHLAKLQALSDQGLWEHLREHTAHPDSGFDWWMFPTDRSSLGQGDRYKLSKSAIESLRADPEFMESYRKGVKLVLLSWGFDATTDRMVQNRHQRWTNYQVRLGKMVHSLTLFKEDELLLSIKKFCDERGITPNLEPWIRHYLSQF